MILELERVMKRDYSNMKRKNRI